MKLFDAFTKKAPNKVFLSIVLGALSGVSYSMLIPLVITSLEPASPGLESQSTDPYLFLSFEVSNHQFAGLFLFTCMLILIARSLSQIILTRVSMDVTADLRLDMYNRIAKAPISALESMGSSKLIAILTTDVPRIIQGTTLIPIMLISVVTLFGMLGFLLYLNSDVFWFVIAIIVFGSLTYQIPVIFGNRYLAKSRDNFDNLQESIRGLIYGAKELKINHVKCESYFKDVLANYEQEVMKTNKTGYTIILTAATYGDLISFFVIGAVAYIFTNYHTINPQDLIGTIMALLYITGPIALILNAIPAIFIAKISLNKVNTILSQIPEEEISKEILPATPWKQLRFDQVTYHHLNPDNTPGFKIGPLNLAINKGEVTFIVGGNGSGKSTLSKLITLHYMVEDGTVFFDDHAVTKDTISTWRQDIAVIYSDYYLFDRLHGIDSVKIKPQVDAYLKALGLERKVTFEDGKFSSLALSDGQKRRLALLVSFIDDKELYLFDEWAADQDPTFKAVFYEQLLPGLRAKGKAVVVISHDDRYFDLADQVIVMEEGKIDLRDRDALNLAKERDVSALL